MYSETMKQLFAAFPEQNPNPVFCIGTDGVIIYGNRSSKETFKEWCCEPGTLAPKVLADLVREAGLHNRADLTIGGRLYSFSVIPVAGEEAVFLYGSDVTEQRAAEARLERLSRIIEESINIVFITDYDGTIEYVNTMFEKITGYTRDEAVGQNPRILASGVVKQHQYKAMWDHIKSGKTWRGLLKNKKMDGSFYWANGFISPIRNEAGKITHFMAIQEDISEKMAVEERLRYLDEYDRTTGIINRERLVEILNNYLDDEVLPGANMAIIQVNIDGFKLVNDSYGYSVGDQLLKSFADFLKEKARELDLIYQPSRETVVGRLGGDEFALYMFDRNEGEGVGSAETIRRAVERYRFLNGMIRITVSIGIAIYPDHGINGFELLTRCNAATAHAREQGQNRYALFREDTTYLGQAQSILEEKQRIIRAMEEDLFIPWFQPILHLPSRRIHHYEALARLISADGAVLPPSSFIPTAERYGLIADIDRIITEKSIKKQAELENKGKNISISMNLSGKHLGDTRMLNYLQEMIMNSGAAPQCLVFEITETAAIQNMKNAIVFIRELKNMGCKFSLDDFGVGFTSFVHLVEMDVDFLKIDGSFVRRLPESKRDRVLVKTIADMTRSLGIQAIGEFVDREEIITILEEYGVDYAQGYLIGKPAPAMLE